MSELQAALEFQVELSKFYNVDLFQRGYYQVRVALKTAPKSPCKLEVSLPRNTESSLVFPASIINGVAVSKTYQILYRSEDIRVNDVIVFKVYMLVDALRIIESIEEADFQLSVELWFTDEDVGRRRVFSPEQQEKLQCISQRLIKLHLSPTKGLHHHVPLLFDYFHLSVMCVTIHATLLALHQPYINLTRQQPKPAWAQGKANTSTMETVLFGNNNTPSTNNRYALNPRLQQACLVHRKICNILLSAYESLQTSYETLCATLPERQQIRIEHTDCHKRLAEVSGIAEAVEDEEDLFQVIQSTIAQLCAQNVILWSQYVEALTLQDKVTFQLAKEHHLGRVKRFAEAFFTHEKPKQEMLACYEQGAHGHSDLATIVRSSHYFRYTPALLAECTEMDGDETTLPIIFEDAYCEVSPAKHFHTSVDGTAKDGSSETSYENVVLRRKESSKSNRSDNSSSYSGDSASPKFRRPSRKRFIKNVRPETLKRPSSMYDTEVRNSVAFDQSECTLVGYRKVLAPAPAAAAVEEPQAALELGTLNPAICLDQLPNLFNAVSMPTLLAKGHMSMINSGSMPELSGVTTSGRAISSTGVDAASRRRKAQSVVIQGTVLSTLGAHRDDVKLTDLETGSTTDCESSGRGAPSDSGISQDHVSFQTLNSAADCDSLGEGAIENGYVPSGSSDSDSKVDSPTDRANMQQTKRAKQGYKLATESLGEPDDTSSTYGDVVHQEEEAEQLQSRDLGLEGSKDLPVEASKDSGLGDSKDLSPEGSKDSGLEGSKESGLEVKKEENKVQEPSTGQDCEAIPNGSHGQEVGQGHEEASQDQGVKGDSSEQESVRLSDVEAVVDAKSDQVEAVEKSTIVKTSPAMGEASQASSSNGKDSSEAVISDDSPSSDNCQMTVLELLKDEYEKTTSKKEKKTKSKANTKLVGAAALSAAKAADRSAKTRESSGVASTEASSASAQSRHRLAAAHSSFPSLSASSGRDGAAASSSTTGSPAHQPAHHIVSSASLPELSALDQDHAQTLVNPVPDKTISFITAKETLRKNLRFPGHLYSDFPGHASQQPYFWPPEGTPRGRMDEGIHLIVCVHGLDGNSADLRLVRTYLEMALPGEKVDFLMSERNQPDTFADFDVMTDRLVDEIIDYLSLYGMDPARISFVGHSLGNLIIRSALSHPKMSPLLSKLYTFLSLSGPHLGTLYNSSGLVNMGMWFMQKWKKSGSLLQLSLKDHHDPRQSFLYKLSQKTGLEMFKNILLVGSQQDRYVPYHSSRIELCRSAVRDSSGMGGVYAEMVSNILQPIVYKSDINFIRYDVFHALPSTANTLIGRAAHIAVLDSEMFIEKFFIVTALKYFK